MSYIVLAIVVVIILLQLFFFVKNWSCMNEYEEIFISENSWGISKDEKTGFVNGITGKGNKTFLSIKESMNKYLENNTGSVIDFTLLKDAVDRHCDSAENEIGTLIPIPLYCGLAGTMAGVIVGIGSLIMTGAIGALLTSGSNSFNAAADGVSDLLSGVALAMLASICGILLTTISSLLFKKSKQKSESGKNTFLAWLQANLLPELPSDTSDALKSLVVNLNKFNKTFSTNTLTLKSTFSEVNESYRIQAEIIKAVHDMDVAKMAKVNIKVLKELQDCTDKLQEFNTYLNSVNEYTSIVKTFTDKLQSESSRLNVLEEIRNFFTRHKAEIAKETADADDTLRIALKQIKETASTSTTELRTSLTKQTDEFKRFITEEGESFKEISTRIQNDFHIQLAQTPMVLKQMAEIPVKLNELTKRIEQSNKELATQVCEALKAEHTTQSTKETRDNHAAIHTSSIQDGWMKWTIVISIILITIACITNTANNICHTTEDRTTPSTTILQDSPHIP